MHISRHYGVNKFFLKSIISIILHITYIFFKLSNKNRYGLKLQKKKELGNSKILIIEISGWLVNNSFVQFYHVQILFFFIMKKL